MFILNGNFETLSQVDQTCKVWARFSITRIRQYIILGGGGGEGGLGNFWSYCRF